MESKGSNLVLHSELMHRRLNRGVSISFADDDLQNMKENRNSFCRSSSGGVPLSKLRSRSTSLQTSQLAATSGFKRTLLTMSGRRQNVPKNRTGSLSVDQEAKAITSQVEITFAAVRKKLTELSAEDMMLQERMHKLSSDIIAMKRYIVGMNAAKKAKASSKSRTLPIVSGKHTLSLPLSEYSWEEETDSAKNSEEDGMLHPHHLSLLANSKTNHSDGNDSPGSRSGSLADSEGSVSSPGITQATCDIVINDGDDSSTSTPTRPLKSVSAYEDDVFLS